MKRKTLRQGDAVRITVDNAGALESVTDGGFVCLVKRGTVGVFDGPHHRLAHWFIVRVEHEGREVFVPLAASMFERVEVADPAAPVMSQACGLYGDHEHCFGTNTLGTKPCGCACHGVAK